MLYTDKQIYSLGLTDYFEVSHWLSYRIENKKDSFLKIFLDEFKKHYDEKFYDIYFEDVVSLLERNILYSIYKGNKKQQFKEMLKITRCTKDKFMESANLHACTISNSNDYKMSKGRKINFVFNFYNLGNKYDDIAKLESLEKIDKFYSKLKKSGLEIVSKESVSENGPFSEKISNYDVSIKTNDLVVVLVENYEFSTKDSNVNYNSKFELVFIKDDKETEQAKIDKIAKELEISEKDII